MPASKSQPAAERIVRLPRTDTTAHTVKQQQRQQQQQHCASQHATHTQLQSQPQPHCPAPAPHQPQPPLPNQPHHHTSTNPPILLPSHRCRLTLSCSHTLSVVDTLAPPPPSVGFPALSPSSFLSPTSPPCWCGLSSLSSPSSRPSPPLSPQHGTRPSLPSFPTRPSRP